MSFAKKMKDLVIEKSKDSGLKKLVFVEGWSNRMQAAVKMLITQKIANPIMIYETKEQFNVDKNWSGAEFIVIEEQPELTEELSQAFFEKRKGKEKIEDIRVAMKQAPLFSAMLVETGKADGCVGGIHNPTANILRAAFKAIGPIDGVKTISSVMVMHKADQWFIFTDISVNPQPNKEQLIDIAKNAADFGDVINFKKKIAFLSYSTAGSAVTEQTKMIAEATREYNDKFQPKYRSIGEIQFDAAFDLDIREQKYKYDDGFKKMPTIFVFPDLNAGNIGYKIAQRMGGFGAVGPIITGLKKPMNDLSRGSTVDDIFNTAVLTALQAYGTPEKNIYERD